jgi:hypothetical protein
MATKPWTVLAVYLHGQEEIEPYSLIVEAKDRADARSKALNKAEYSTKVLFVLPGKVQDAGIEDLHNVVPIRGKKHEIEVTHVRIAKRKFFIPGRCPDCKKDLRRAGAMLEKFIEVRTWAGHLSHNNKDFIHERDFKIHMGQDKNIFDMVMLICSECRHIVWDGLHADE